MAEQRSAFQVRGRRFCQPRTRHLFFLGRDLKLGVGVRLDECKIGEWVTKGNEDT